MLRNKFINELKLKSVYKYDECINEWKLYHYIINRITVN
jgi:hypothetical protein